MAPGRRWVGDRALVGELASVLGWDPADGLDRLVAALSRGVVAGSTAKLAAMRRGEVPPGADPQAIARSLLAAASGTEAHHAWSCWPMTTVAATLVATAGLGRARVVALRRIDRRSPPFDVHSAVLVETSGTTWLVDPYFSVVLGGPGADPVETVDRGAWAMRTDEPDERWSLRVASGRWPDQLRYRVLGVDLDAGDVAALCAVSTTHSGTPFRPTARVRTADSLVEAWATEAGAGGVRERRWGSPDGLWGAADRLDLASWADAARELGDRTGFRLDGRW